MLWHLLTLGAMVTCGCLAAWQWQRAGSAMGSALNVGYGLQWPLFAMFFGVMWWRLLRHGGRGGSSEAARAGSGAGTRVHDPRGAGTVAGRAVTVRARPRDGRADVRREDPDDPRLVAYNQMLAELAERDVR